MDDFWSSINQIAAIEATSAFHVGQILDLYFDIVADAWPFLSDDEPFVCARLLLNSRALKFNPKFTQQRLKACLNTAPSKSQHWTCFLAIVLGVEDSCIALLEKPQIDAILQLLYMFQFEDRTLTLLFQLLFVALVRKPLDMTSFDRTLCRMILQHVCETDSREVSGAGIMLLAALNHRYAQEDTPNLAAEILSDAPHRFGECLVWQFNRCTSNPQLICKLLYQVFAYDLFYFNDLKVLVDILLRELIDISRDNEQVRELYLMVLHKVLDAPALAAEPYKRGELVRALRANYEGTSGHLLTLVNECLAVPWLEWKCAVHESPHGSLENVALARDVPEVTPFTVGESPFEACERVSMSPELSPFSPCSSPDVKSPFSPPHSPRAPPRPPPRRTPSRPKPPPPPPRRSR